MISQSHAMLLILVMSAVTIILRALPFLVLGGRKTPSYILYLGRVLPFAIIAMLVVYCLKDVNVFSGSHGIPELVACVVTAGLHVWRRNTLLSILGGTICYMAMVQYLIG